MIDSTTHSINFGDDINASLPADMHCKDCAVELCMRQKLINFATGRMEVMYCLSCLGKIENMQAGQLLVKIKKYILSRQCFQKEWMKYSDISFCPDPEICLPHKLGDE